MKRTNRVWLPSYSNPDALLPKIPETRALFSRRPYLIQDYVGKAIRFLGSEDARTMGLDYDHRKALPCRWKCSDESLFGVDLAIYAHTRAYPFDKGKIGGHFYEDSLGAAVHHGRTNIDVGGSHVGYVPDEGGGSFGRIWRPAQQEYSTDCGYLCGLIAPFQKVYDDACKNILLCRPAGERVLISVPNEYVQPSWSRSRVKLLVDLENLTDGEVEYRHDQPHTHTLIGRTLFLANDAFLDTLDEATLARFATPTWRRIGQTLKHRFFHIFDSEADLEGGLPRQRLLLYMKFILSASNSPGALKAAIINTALEHNRLTDAVRSAGYIDYDFVSFSGVFIDLYSRELKSYLNLFQPMGMTIKLRGKTREREFTSDEIHEIFDGIEPAAPQIPLETVFGYEHPGAELERFTYEPGKFTRV